MTDGYHSPVGTETVQSKSFYENYTGRLLVLNPSCLKEEYRFEEFQYFFAQSGFGCDPSSLGTKVFGKFLIDGEKACFRRDEFLGIADPEKLPAWASEKLLEMAAPKNEGPAQNGITL